MAEKTISPGVFTEERDLTFLPEGIAEIGANIIGLYEKGPAFQPKVVSSQNEFIKHFGNNNEELYAPYTAKSYLQNAGQATITRILGENGYSGSNPIAISVSGSSNVTTVLAPTKELVSNSNLDPELSASLQGVGSASDFVLQISSSLGQKGFSCSLDPNDASYIERVFGTDPHGNKPVYVRHHFKQYVSSSVTLTNSVSLQTSYTNTPTDFRQSYTNGSTPWITSQHIGGNVERLFKIHTLSDGDVSNTEIKVSITNVKTADEVVGSDYGTFNIIVRDFSDSDRNQDVLETFTGLTLDPDSNNFVARRIGDMYTQVTQSSATDDVKVEHVGQYENNSDYIRIEMAPDFKSLDPQLIPFGFEPYKHPVGGDIDNQSPALDYKTDRVIAGSTSSDAHYGVDFTSADSLEYFNPVPAGASTGSQSDFNLQDSPINTDITSSKSNRTAASLRKFSLGFQTGFDGFHPSVPRLTSDKITGTNTQGLDLSTDTSSGTKLFDKALNIISNKDAYDINLITMPGVLHNYHSDVTKKAIDVVEDRADVFYVMDTGRYDDSIDTVVDAISDVDTSYAGTYHPWVKINDFHNDSTVWVPPSVVMPTVYAFNDSVAAEWFAPAGLNRGGIDDAIDVSIKLSKDERDVLYENRINPIASFTDSGIVAWGQKTLQTEASALDRINVRRLLIEAKKTISEVSSQLVFEQNNAQTRNRFLNIVNPYLESIQQRSGLYDFRVVMDESNNPPEVIDRNIMVGEIFLQPTRTAEFIRITFNLLPTGASFEE